MADSTTGIGPRVSTGLSKLVEALGERPERTGTAAGRGSGTGIEPRGKPGQRILSAAVAVEDLDHSAPRGTYLDVLV